MALKFQYWLLTAYMKRPPEHLLDTLWQTRALLQRKTPGLVWITCLQFLNGILVTLTPQTWEASLQCWAFQSRSQVAWGSITHSHLCLFVTDVTILHLGAGSLNTHKPRWFGGHLPKRMLFLGANRYILMFEIWGLSPFGKCLFISSSPLCLKFTLLLPYLFFLYKVLDKQYVVYSLPLIFSGKLALNRKY